MFITRMHCIFPKSAVVSLGRSKQMITRKDAGTLQLMDPSLPSQKSEQFLLCA
jgi:hypothetical protein